MLNFLFLARLQTDDVVFLVEQESILYVLSVTGEYLNHLGSVGLGYQQQHRPFRLLATSGKWF